MYLASNLKLEKKKRNEMCREVHGPEYEYEPEDDVYKNYKTVYEYERTNPFDFEKCVKTTKFDKTTDKLKRYYPNIRNEYQCKQVNGHWNPSAINRQNLIDDGVCFVRESDNKCTKHDKNEIIKARREGKRALTSYEFKSLTKCTEDKLCEWNDDLGECVSRDAMDIVHEVSIPKLPSNWPTDITRAGFQSYLAEYYNRMLDAIPQKYMNIFGTGNRCISKSGEVPKRMASQPQTVVNMVFRALAKNPETTNRGLLVFHGVGSGKTCTAAAVMEAFWDYPDKNIVFASSIEGIAANPPIEFISCAKDMFPRFKQDTDGLSDDQHLEKVKQMFERRKVHFFTFAQLAHFLLIANPLKVKPELVDYHKNFLKDAVLIIDEVHNIFKPLPHQRHEHTALKEFLASTQNPHTENLKIAVLTATPGDTPEDVVELINFVRDKRFPPIPVPDLGDAQSVLHFGKQIRGLISYFEIASDMSKYPRIVHAPVHKAPMSMSQYTKYVEVFNELKPADKDYEALVKEDRTDRYFKAARKYSNMLFNLEKNMQLKEFSSKLPLLIENIKRYPNEKHYVYSTFFENRGFGGHGILAIAKLLEKELKYEKIDWKQAEKLNAAKALPSPKRRYMLAITTELGGGGAPKKAPVKAPKQAKAKADNHSHKKDSVGDRLKELTKFYNHSANSKGDYVHVFLASQKFNEGVDFKAIRHIHIFEPFLSFNKENQTIGRGARYCSHRDLNIDNGEWKVTVHKYIADFPVEVKEVDLGKLRALIDASKTIIKENEKRLDELKGQRGKDITETRNTLKDIIKQNKNILTDVSKQLKKWEILDTSKYFMIDQKIEQEVQEKLRKMTTLFQIMKSASVDCKLFRKFHAQSGNEYTCVE